METFARVDGWKLELMEQRQGRTEGGRDGAHLNWPVGAFVRLELPPS